MTHPLWTPGCDEGPHHGLGSLSLPEDIRDFPLALHYEATGIEAAAVLPAKYIVPKQPPRLNQGATSQCTCYSTAAAFQQQETKAGRPLANFDEPRLFKASGGGPGGANARDVFTQLIRNGYATRGHNDGAVHKLKAYYSVPLDTASLHHAIFDFGNNIVIAIEWFHSWFHPLPNGTLPKPDYSVGFHLIEDAGWNDNPKLGDELVNSWSAAWGKNGICYLPYAYRSHVQAAFKLVHA